MFFFSNERLEDLKFSIEYEINQLKNYTSHYYDKDVNIEALNFFIKNSLKNIKECYDEIDEINNKKQNCTKTFRYFKNNKYNKVE